MDLAGGYVHLPLFPNPHFLEQRFWTLPPSYFHWDTTHAAASLISRSTSGRLRASCSAAAVSGIDSPQRLKVEGSYLLVTSGVSGGNVYQIYMDFLN